jgi:hypothetical protein
LTDCGYEGISSKFFIRPQTTEKNPKKSLFYTKAVSEGSSVAQRNKKGSLISSKISNMLQLLVKEKKRMSVQPPADACILVSVKDIVSASDPINF